MKYLIFAVLFFVALDCFGQCINAKDCVGRGDSGDSYIQITTPASIENVDTPPIRNAYRDGFKDGFEEALKIICRGEPTCLHAIVEVGQFPWKDKK